VVPLLVEKHDRSFRRRDGEFALVRFEVRIRREKAQQEQDSGNHLVAFTVSVRSGALHGPSLINVLSEIQVAARRPIAGRRHAAHRVSPLSGSAGGGMRRSPNLPYGLLRFRDGSLSGVGFID
jgi:hypothetical protein